mmetsp:Transcript_43462/g.136285  ORF Transcript_43462/g.136285 Transcript_43462/m.136285 type:complete len:492 (-) Transcript_43462:21-1496(-)
MTYKYLGLRMFAHPWSGDALSGYPPAVGSALRDIARLNAGLTRRAEEHAAALGTDGSSDFSVVLINRMGAADEVDALDRRRGLKTDPDMGGAKVRVSWHADSCLEHFSTIAVYHFLPTENTNQTKKNEKIESGWRVALRVQRDAEGPNAGRSRRAGVSDLTGGVPSQKVDMGASGSCYYMLGDFNHDHQHAVLAGNCERISSTHRVGKREGHDAGLVLDKTRRVLAAAKRCPKQWASEGRALDELEFEWLRQWFVQGAAHAALHAPYWADVIAETQALWTRLEAREALKVRMLENAARVAAARGLGLGSEPNPNSNPSPNPGRTSPTRRERKHADAVAQVGGAAAYDVVLQALRLRRDKRRGWGIRVADKMWDKLPEPFRPMPLPLFDDAGADNGEEERLPEDLDGVISDIERWKAAYLRDSGGAAAGPNPNPDPSPKPSARPQPNPKKKKKKFKKKGQPNPNLNPNPKPNPKRKAMPRPKKNRKEGKAKK